MESDVKELSSSEVPKVGQLLPTKLHSAVPMGTVVVPARHRIGNLQETVLFVQHSQFQTKFVIFALLTLS